MKYKKIMIAGLIVMLVVVISVFAIGTQTKSWYGHKDWKKSGEYTHKTFDKNNWLEKVGLTEDATEEEIIAAKKELWADKADYTEDKSNWLEKMGLTEDATEEEIIAAKKGLWADKADFHKGSGFHKGCSKS